VQNPALKPVLHVLVVPRAKVTHIVFTIQPLIKILRTRVAVAIVIVARAAAFPHASGHAYHYKKTTHYVVERATNRTNNKVRALAEKNAAWRNTSRSLQLPGKRFVVRRDKAGCYSSTARARLPTCLPAAAALPSPAA
jgi:hypothetical protein